MKSIRNKLGAFITTLICFTAVTITVFAMIMFYKGMTSQLEESVQALATSYGQTINNKIDNFKSELQIASSLEQLTTGTETQRNALLATLAKKAGFNYLAIADESGNTTRRTQIGDRDYFKKALEGEIAISSPIINRADGMVTLMVAAMIENQSGTRSVLYGGVTYSEFSDVINNIKIGEGGYAFIIDGEGTMVAHPNNSLVVSRVNYVQEPEDISVSNALARMVKGESGFNYTEYQGEKRILSFAPIGNEENWSVGVSIPLSQVMTQTYKTIAVSAGASLLLIIISILLALKFASMLSKPLVAATGRIELLAEGNLADPVPTTKGHDEIARLGVALGNTVGELNMYINDISMMLSSMAANDFTVSSNTQYKGAFMPIHDALANIASALSQTMTTIATATQQVDSGAGQISAGAQSLAASASEQAAAVEELSAGVEKVATQEDINLQMLRQAVLAMQQVNTGVQDGTQEMKRLNTAMEHIASSSEQIGNITRLIEDIAFQTNILSLNAAVEAARAGDAGKGFAVVADEVRNLAAKSADAAKRTADLISSSSEAVSEGTMVADKTVSMLLEIAQQAEQAVQSIATIETASDEQSVAISQMAESIAQVSTVVQNNAATAEENSAASEELSAIAGQLKQEVAKFKLLQREDLLDSSTSDYYMDTDERQMDETSKY